MSDDLMVLYDYFQTLFKWLQQSCYIAAQRSFCNAGRQEIIIYYCLSSAV